jgi:hypothetical protein
MSSSPFSLSSKVAVKDDFLNSGFMSQEEEIDYNEQITTTSFDIDKYFLETTVTRGEYYDDMDDISITRCVYTHPTTSNNIIYSPIINYNGYDSPTTPFNHISSNKFNNYRQDCNSNGYESPLSKINEASFDLSDSCFLCNTTMENGECVNESQFDAQFLQVSSITDFNPTNSIESSFPSTLTMPSTNNENNNRSCIDIKVASNSIEHEASSVFTKRNESGRISCKSIYSYLIKPIKNKFKIGCNSSNNNNHKSRIKQAKNCKTIENKEQPTKPKPIFQYSRANNAKFSIHKQPYYNAPHCLSKPVNEAVSSKYETMFVDKNKMSPNESLALANQFHNCGDLVYYLV